MINLHELVTMLQELIDLFIKNEKESLHLLAILMITIGFIVFIILMYQPATYGRYSNTGRIYSVAVPPKTAWFLQELPSFLIPTLLMTFSLCGYEKFGVYSTSQLIVLSCFTLHYFQRTFIYSLKLQGGKPTPLFAFLLATIFCTVNGYMQARGALLLTVYHNNTQTLLRIGVGILIFAYGVYVNIYSDHLLRNLRKPGEKGYKVPRGGWFEYVSCANFFGEMIEWFGFFVASFSSVSFAFSFFTVANLLPRAIFHHRWYKEKFEDYPKNRKAVIPFLI